MNKKNKIYGIYLPALFLALPIVIILRTIACITSLESNGYFKNYVLINISNIIVLFVSLFFLTYLFTARKNMRFIPTFDSALSYGPSAIVGASLFFIAFHLFRTGSLSKDSDFLAKYTIILGIVATLAIIYFIASGVSVKRRSIKRADFGLIVLVFLCMYIIYIFFDRKSPINTPAKIVDELAFLSTALFFLYETRLSLGREKWRGYITFGLISTLLTGYSAIPSLITYFATGRVVSISIYETVLTLSFFIFALFKLALTGELVEERNSDVVKKLISYSNERQIELAPKEEPDSEAYVEDENQLSISDITVEAELIDAPTAEETFFYEPEPTPLDQSAVWINPEDDEGLYPHTDEEDQAITNEEDTLTVNEGEQAE